MLIEELQQGQAITLVAKLGTEIKEFQTTVRSSMPKRHILIADPILYNDKPIGFSGAGVLVDLEFQPPDSPPMVFKEVRTILTKTKEDGYIYAISCSREAKVNNRRNNFRLYVGKKVVVQSGANHSTFDAFLKDISSSGFAFVTNPILGAKTEKVDLHENQVVHTIYSDRIEETFMNYDFNMSGIIVRKVVSEDGTVLYGCKLNNKVPGLDNYIMTKERLRVKLDR